ncbi:hypothetical protein [Enterococcus avium]|uniref:hypothetical protein n=1 Tax=Enterococcus avium TaxID=33945 RepID=UPI0035CAA9BA
MKIYGIEFNQFTVVKHSDKPVLKVESGWGVFDGKRSISVHAFYDGKRDIQSLMSSEDDDDIEYFQELCEDFNLEADWDSAYSNALHDSADYFRRNIEKENKRLSEIEQRIAELKKLQ